LGKEAEGRSRLYHPEHDRLFRKKSKMANK